MAPQAANGYGTSAKDEEAGVTISVPPNGMAKTQGENFIVDFQNFAEGTIPQSVLVAATIGTCIHTVPA